MINDRIKERELFIYNKEIDLFELKKSFDLQLFEATSKLEDQYKELKLPHLSNIEKRQYEAMQNDALISMQDKIIRIDREIKALKIELEYDKREFNLRLSASEDLQEIRLELKRIGDILAEANKIIK